MRWIELSWGEEQGATMWAPGLPAQLVADGKRIGWLGRGGVFALGDTVAFLSTPPVVALSAGGAVWAAAVEGGELWWGVPGQPWRCRPLPPGRIRLGGALLAWRQGGRGGLQTLAGQPVVAPIGALDAWPWPSGWGASWWSERYLYRLTAQVTLAAILPGPITGGVIGPEGAAVLVVDDVLFAIAPGALPVPLTIVATTEGARLSASRALLVIEGGVGLFCLETGALLAAAEGALAPVGFAPEPCVLDEQTGSIHVLSADGLVPAPLAEGFLPGAVLQDGERVYGPGGAAWSLRDGTRLFAHPALSAVQLLITPAGLLCVGLEEAVLLDPSTGAERDRWSLPGDEELWREGELQLDGEVLWLCADDDTFALDLAGNPLDAQPPAALPAPADEPAPPVDPLLPDAGATIGGRCWLWSDDGLLVSRPLR